MKNPAQSLARISPGIVSSAPDAKQAGCRSFNISLLLVLLAGWAAAPGALGQDYTFATVAGFAGRYGYAGGVGIEGNLPLFNSPTGLVVDPTDGNIYVSDAGNSLIRKVTSAGVVTTLAGTVGISGGTDGKGKAATFSRPQGSAVDSKGNIYVAEYGSSIIRQIALDGTVTTVAGLINNPGYTDATGTAARFRNPTAVAVDSAGTIYVADAGNQVIRKIAVGGVVTTLAGIAGVRGFADKANSTASSALFADPRGVAVDQGGNVYVADTGNDTIRKITPDGSVVSTVAGAPNTYGNVDGASAAARFNLPNSLVVQQSTGRIFVADQSNNTIRMIDTSGNVTTLAGNAVAPDSAGAVDGTGLAARFNFPSAVAIDAAGNLYVADYNNQLIRKVTQAGLVTTIAGAKGIIGSQDGSGSTLAPSSVAFFHGPAGTAAAGGKVYVADAGNNAIRAIDSTGFVTTLAGNVYAAGRVDANQTAASFDGPNGVTLDSAGNLYVADTNNDLIRKVTPTGTVTTIAGTGGVEGSTDGAALSAKFDEPSGVAWDATSGNLYVADFSNHTIRKITAAGVVSTLAGTAGVAGQADGTGSAARFNYPRDVAVDGAGNIYVADSGNHTLRKITPAGAVSTLAGTAGAAGSADGTGSAARFDALGGVAVDGAGNIIVSDTNNSTIRLVTAAGVVTTIGGKAGTVGSADGKGNAALFDHPLGLSVDAYGYIYIADNRNHTIRVGISSTGSGGIPGGPPSGTPHGPTGTNSGGPAGGTPNGTTDGSTVGKGFVLRPSGITADPVGNFYVTDTANNCIKRIAADLTVTVFAGQSGKTGSTDGTGAGALFNGPIGILADNSGNLVVCDTGNATIRRITSAGVVTTLAGSASSHGSTDGTGSAALFSNPTGIAVDTLGNFYVSDSNNGTIRMITTAGVVTTFAGTATSIGDTDGVGKAARFNNPTGVGIDGGNNVYVADTNNDTIRKIRTAAVVTTATAVGTITGAGNASATVSDAALAGSPITISVPVAAGDTPAIWAGKVQSLITADKTISAKYTATVSGTLISIVGSAGDTTDTTLNLALANGTCTGIVNAPTSATILSGQVTTVAGSTGLSGVFDGTGEYALFNLPAGLAVTSTGALFVADTGNNCIRQVTSGGVVSTIAGIAGISGRRDGTVDTALFNQPQALFATSATILVADTGNSVIRLISSSGGVTTAALKDTSSPTPTPTPTPSSGGGGALEPWFALALLLLGGLACGVRRRAVSPAECR